MCWKFLAARGLCALVTVASSMATVGTEPPAQVVLIDQLPLRKHLDLGQYPPGEQIELALTLQSDLGKPLSILSIEPDCGCLDVKHDTKRVSDDGALLIHLRLAPSRKLGRIRRNLRIFFEQERTSPLDIGIDTRIVGPIGFATSTVAVRSTNRSLELLGSKSDQSVEVLSCKPTRGTCRVVSIKQSADEFIVNVDPLIAFGRANELFRIRYRDSGDREPKLVELPLEFECVSPLRFLPSLTPIRFEEDAWCAIAKLVVVPETDLDFESLKLSIERGDGRSLDDSEFRVDLSRTSVVLYSMHIRCTTSSRDSDRPARLHVASPNGELLATLDFFNP